MKNRTQHQFIRSLDRFSVGPLPLSYIDYVPNLFLVYDLDLIHNQHPFSASSCSLARVGPSTSRRHLRTGGRSSWREVGEQRYGPHRSRLVEQIFARFDQKLHMEWGDGASQVLVGSPFSFCKPKVQPFFFYRRSCTMLWFPKGKKRKRVQK